MRTSTAFLLVFLLAACREESVDLGLFCGKDAQETVMQSSAIAYGMDVPPPQVEKVHVLKETDLFQVKMGDPQKLGLLATDTSGGFHHVTCSDALCSVQDAEKALNSCKDQPQCRIVGAVKTATFYPLYLSDDTGGHVCASRWGEGQ